ncbi:MAG: fumarylacetoacetate hydrolase family protein [Conexivisphaerales archaeon]
MNDEQKMKVARFIHSGISDYGFIKGRQIVPASSIAFLPKTIEDFIGKSLQNDAELLKQLESTQSKPISSVRFLSPLAKPGKIICIGRNYREHIEEAGQKVPEGLPIFLKPLTSLAGPYDEIKYPSITNALDYEGEMVVIMGKEGKEIDEKDSLKHVFGLAIMNDLTARDLQMLDGQWTRGKGFDSSAPFGPWITTLDEIANPRELSIKTWVNGQLRQSSNTSKMIRGIEKLIEIISQGMTLQPGDIISTGTPEGTGYYMKPEKRLLSKGDIVRVEVSGLGYIQNRIV